MSLCPKYCYYQFTVEKTIREVKGFCPRLQANMQQSWDSNRSVHSTNASVQFSSVQLLSHVRLFATPWTAARQASRPITNSWSFLKLMSIESVMPSNHRLHPCAKSGYMDTFIILLVPPPTSRGRSHHPYFTDEKTNCTREKL